MTNDLNGDAYAAKYYPKEIWKSPPYDGARKIAAAAYDQGKVDTIDVILEILEQEAKIHGWSGLNRVQQKLQQLRYERIR